MSLHEFIPLYLSHSMMHHQTVSFGNSDPLAQHAKWHQFYAGMQRIISTPYQRTTITPPACWHAGSCTLHHYGKAGLPVLFVPSLINRAYIFDLSEEHSMARFLVTQGFNSYLIDWNTPTEAEHGFDVASYVSQRLVPAIEHIYHNTGKPVTLVGYCMGGMMALAAAQLLPEHIYRLTLLATPWDFSARVHHLSPAKNDYQDWLTSLCDNSPIIAGNLIHQLFYYANPWIVYDKYSKFAQIPVGSAQEQSIIEREHWLHDTVDITAGSARDCMLHWPLENTPHAGKWLVDGQLISPTKITTPTLLVSAQHDAIIPPAASQPLLKNIANIRQLTIPSGHISMVSGHNAQEHLWIPLANWLRNG